MDRGIRPTDSKSVVTTSTGDNYFSEQALRAGLLANELNRSEMIMKSDPLREALHREYEKERIRDEIIRDEIRRREIEAEVRRELALERELALRRGDGYSFLGTSSAPSLWSEPRLGMLDRHHGIGFGLTERLPLSVRSEPEPFERLPFQRNPVAAKMTEIGNGQAKIIHLAKPTITTSPILAGTKRKLTTTEAANDSNQASGKKKPQEWNCSLCQVTTTSEDGLKCHLQGRKHKNKEALLTKPNPGKKKNKSSPKNDNKPEVQAMKKQMISDLKKKKYDFWCEDCQVGCHSETVMNNHCKGKKHINRVATNKQAGGSASSTTTSTTKNVVTTPETTTNKNDVTTPETTTKNDVAVIKKIEDGEDKVVKEEGVNKEELGEEVVETELQEEGGIETMESAVTEEETEVQEEEGAIEKMESTVDEVAEGDGTRD